MSIGGYIAKKREEKGLSLKDLSDLTVSVAAEWAENPNIKPVSIASIQTLETGKVANPGNNTCHSLFLALQEPVHKICLITLGMDPEGPTDIIYQAGLKTERLDEAMAAGQKAFQKAFMEVLKNGD